MNPEIKGKWLEALRSGRYQQGTRMLRYRPSKNVETEEYCCLGVLCDLAVAAEVIPAPEELGLNGVTYAYGPDGDVSLLPEPVMLWAGLETRLGSRRGMSLASLNDNGASFAKIAVVIEEEF